MVKNIKAKQGFTIIELIIVMAIIGLLVLMAVPTYKEYYNNAKELQYEANVEAVEKAIMSFTVQYPDFEDDLKTYTTQTKYSTWTGFIYIKPKYLAPYFSESLTVTDDEMQEMHDGYIRVEYTAKKADEMYNFEIQVGGSTHDRPKGKEYGRYYYDPK